MTDRSRYPTDLVRVRGRFVFTCPGCAARREHEFTRTVRADRDELLSDSEWAARVAAGREPDAPSSPCPRCGARLPQGAARRRQWWDQWPAVFVPTALLFGLPLALLARHPWVYWLLIVLAPVAVAVELAWLRWVGRRFPTLGGRTGPDGEPYPPEPAPRRPVAYGVLVAAVVVLLAHPIFRGVTGLPLNEQCAPMVIGPGSRVNVYVDNDLEAVKGVWGGTGRVTVRNAAALGMPVVLPTDVPSEPDDSQFTVKSGEKGNRPDTKAAVTLPDDPGLAGRTVQLRIDLSVTYSRQGAVSFVTPTPRFLTSAAYICVARPKW